MVRIMCGSLLLGYTGEDVEGKHVNRYFPGGLIGMAPPLAADIAHLRRRHAGDG